MSLGQAALKWVLAEPTVTSAQPNIYDLEQLEEFAAAPDLPDLTPADLREVAALYARNFGLQPDLPSDDSPHCVGAARSGADAQPPITYRR